MIDQVTIDRILDAARIEEVVGEFVTLRKRGVNFTGLCPFHDERTPSFSVSPSKGICKCFSCGKGGNVVHFIMEHEQLSYYEALKWLAHKYNIEIKERALSPEEQQSQNDRESMFILNEFARDYFSRILFEHAEGKSLGLGYFRERGFREDILRKFQLGFSLEAWDPFSKEALAKGYQKDYLVRTGLSLINDKQELHDRYRGRVIFPVHTLSGKVVAFGGRILKQHEKSAKYVNSPESEIYHKSNELYGIYFAKQAIAKQDRCYLVEGYTDVISMHQAGIENVVSSSGTALTHGQIRLIHRFTNNVTVLYDGDAAGIKASLKGINMLLEEGLNIRVLLLPDGEDPDSFSKKCSASAFAQYLKEHETDFIKFKTDILLKDAGSDPIARANLIQDIVESIALISDDITRQVYIRECSRQLEFSEALLFKEVGKRRRAETPGATAATRNTPQNTHTTTPIAPKQASNETVIQQSRFDPYEANIIKHILRYGNDAIFVSDTLQQGKPAVTVLAYIAQELEQDEIQLENPIYQRILLEAIEKSEQSNFEPQRYFINHRDPEISRVAANMISEPYELSKIHHRFQEVVEEKNRLDELIPHILLDLKYALVDAELQALHGELKKATGTKDETKLHELFVQIQDLLEIKKDIARYLGERIVVHH